ncbi:glycosyltransferase [Falsiroseomonas tokyonensis]|uniref:Glycosyltransferase n=1 Tax=Falsiroseomonas tokyonensis TaxID=430521 RepID=A0ABV7BTC1_9PROT|nr:glycosyltransferase [Falsiroseomonas tokyonensis]MBU8538436.1 glycosyltransferase [Falsiroseomonas tokyonensis]
MPADTLPTSGIGGLDIGVVIPAYRQPGFLAEALESVLAQQGPLRIGAVVVNDGCPFAQTHATGLAYARRHPDRIAYLRRANGGLSAARNTGVDFLLAAAPACRGIFPLDADNRLKPPMLARAQALLDAAPADCGWVYPDFDFFGFEANYTTAGDYSRFMHLAENVCEAGSLVRREVFASGLRYDESMRQGFEDWDFWLRAAAAGWRGRHLPHSGFQYRKRAESMLATSERQRGTILGQMRNRQARQLQVRHLAPLEAAEVPRFALFLEGEEQVGFLLDPAAAPPASQPIAAARDRFIQASHTPAALHFPPHCAFTTPATLAVLRRSGLLRNIFYHANLALRDAHVLAVTIEMAADGALGLAFTPAPAADGRASRAALILARTQLLQEVARDTYRGWINSLREEAPRPLVAHLAVTLPEATEAPPAVEFLLAEVDAMRDRTLARSALGTEWRTDDRRPRFSAQDLYPELARCGAILPYVPPGDRRDIGFILPLFAFGGVEKVVFNYAAALREQGWRPHLFITGAHRMQPQPGHFEVFESVNFFEGQGIEGGDYEKLHLGAPVSGFANWRDMRDAVGLLASMDVVLNTHALGGHGIMQQLRQQGVQTWLGLHLVEKGPLGNPLGNPHIALAYEGAYDGFVVISDKLRDWCIGQAVPEEKIVRVLNAPSYAADPSAVAQGLAARQVAEDRPLRVLYLGRLDAQKGLERLRDIILETQGPAITWRVVGKAVLNETVFDLSAAGLVIEPPAMTAAALDALYAWADVVVLPSHFEGVPLTILEAQRFGCVMLATDVGAVAEVVRDRVDGFLVSNAQQDPALVSQCAVILQQLAADRARLRQMAAAAAARGAESSWSRNMQDWVLRIEQGLRRTA